MAGVVAERDRVALCIADSAVGAEEQDFLAAQVFRLPTHSDILGPGEQVARRPLAEHLGGEGQGALGAGRVGANVVNRSVAGIEDAFEGGRHKNRLASGRRDKLKHVLPNADKDQ